jgi:glycosyltransferase involved in cell wall biosynthesis
MQREVLEMSDMVLVQTVREAEDLKRTFDIDITWEKVLNGVGRVYIEAKEFEKAFKFDNYIICVGRVEPRKNQISIIEAVKRLREETSLDTHLVLVGKMSVVKHFEYNQLMKECFKKYDWIHHINGVPYEELPSYYHYAKVCVSASWFETTGLTSLEALYCGTNAVASGLRAKEYLGGYASFCMPDSIDSIKNAIKKEYFAPRPSIDEKIREEYTWENAAKRTLEVYKKVLKTKKK